MQRPNERNEAGLACQVDVLLVKGLEVGKGAPKVVVSITGSNVSEVVRQAAAIAASPDIDMAELRLDHLDSGATRAEVVEIVNATGVTLAGKPLLVTFRSAAEGGERSLGDTDYFDLYRAIIEGASVDMVDLEMMKPTSQLIASIALAHGKGIAVVLSNHEFQSTPTQEAIVGRLLRQQALGADILKIATMPQTPEDVLTLISASVEMKTRQARKPLLTMAMGPLGVITRLAGEFTGSALTYASLGAASAPGQLEASAVRTVLDIIERGA